MNTTSFPTLFLTLLILLGETLLPLFSGTRLSPTEPPDQRTAGKPVGETDREASEWSFPGREIGSLTLKNASGDMVLRRSYNGDLHIKATKHDASREDLERVVIDLKRQGDRVIGDVNYLANYSTASVTFLVEAPPGLSVELNSSSGSLRVEGFEGKLTLDTGSGVIELSDAHGEIHASTGSGDISAYYSRPLAQIGPPTSLAESRATWSSHIVRNEQGGNILTRTGRRRAESAPRTFTSGSGNITLHLSGQVQAGVLAETLSRRFKTDFQEVQDTGDGSRFAGSINGGGPVVVLSTSSGRVELKRM